MVVIVDGNNVIGSRPDGWWRDRAAAAHRLLARVQCHVARRGPGARVEVVFDDLPSDLTEGVHLGVRVHGASRRGRNAADDRIVARVAELGGSGDAVAGVEVVTSDRELADRVRTLGSSVTGARTFLERLESCGC